MINIWIRQEGSKIEKARCVKIGVKCGRFEMKSDIVVRQIPI
jgi:hypothetical protein